MNLEDFINTFKEVQYRDHRDPVPVEVIPESHSQMADAWHQGGAAAAAIGGAAAAFGGVLGGAAAAMFHGVSHLAPK